MDDETRQAFQKTARAFGDTAQAFQKTAQSFEETAEALRPRGREKEPEQDPPDRPLLEDPERGVRRFLIAVVIVLALIPLARIVWILAQDPDEPYDGIDTGLVFARCEQPVLGLFAPTVELWAVDPTDAAVLDRGHAEVDLPAHSRLAYPCDTVGGLARRLFDAGFQHTVVAIRDPDTGAERVNQIALVRTGQPRRPVTPESDSSLSPRPHDGLAVYGPDGSTVWYRSAIDGTVHRVPDTGGDVTRIDPQAEAFTVLTQEPVQLFVQGAPSADTWTADLALPNPTGDLAAAPGALHLTAERRAVALRCAALVVDPATACPPGGLGDAGALRPAAWLDDRTLLAVAGPRRGANVLLRVEIAGADRMRACPAIPPSDWTYRAVAVDPDGRSFVADAVRPGDVRTLFAQATDRTDGARVETHRAPDVPDDAHLLTWRPDDGVRSPVPHVCGGGT